MKKRCISFIRNFSIAVFCTFTVFSHCLFGYASNDDEFITFTNSETIQAYRYFSLYGLTANVNSSYNSTYTTIGTISGSATFTVSGNNGISIAGTSEDELHGGLQLFPTDDSSFNLDIISQTMIGQIRPNDDTASHLHLACTYSNYTNGAYENAVCDDPNFFDTTKYNVYLYPAAGGINIEGRPSTMFAHFVDATDTSEYGSTVWTEGTSSFNGTLSLHENGSLSGNGTISLTTTTTDIIHLRYVLPIMSGTINNPNQTSSIARQYRFTLSKDNPFVVAYLAQSSVDDYFDISENNSQSDIISGNTVFNRISSTSRAGMIMKAWENKLNLSDDYYGKYYYSVFKNSNIGNGIIPLYIGYKNYMSDELYRYIYGSDRIIEALEKQTNIIENGNSNSQQKGQQLDTKTSQMQTQMTTFQNIEDTAGDNMNAALQNINTNPSLMSTNKFLVSVDWIRQQYNRLVTNTPFEAVITFCLVFGLGLLLLGKVR